MKDKIFGVLQRVGRSFMLPIALLPVAGLLLGIGSSFTNETMLAAYGLNSVIHPGTLIYTILDVMSQTGSAVFNNLALLFAMGVAIGMARKEKEVAALSGAVAYIIMNTAIQAMINAAGGVEAMPANSTTTMLGITTLQMGVFGGIVVGLGVAALHNKFYKIELPQVLAFFGGTRFVPIISSIVYLVVGIAMFYIWPVVQSGIAALGALVLASGYAGTFIYGLLERALIPFGLHHVFYMPFWQTAVGGTAIIDGVTVTGAQNIFFAELASKSTTVFSVSATRFMAGKFPFMMFGLPGAALAMYQCAKPEKKKVAGGLLLSAALTAFLTGITEPLEFTFIFVALPMYAVHCVLAGLSFMLMHILNVGVGMTFSGGLIDLVLFGVMQGNAKTHWVWVVVVGAVYFVLYYIIFRFMISKFDYKTPGRDDAEEVKLYTRADVNARSAASGSTAPAGDDPVSALIVEGLGGAANLSDVDCCATRLRCTVKDAALVRQDSELEGGERAMNVDWSVPVATVNDSPRFGYRGVMIDVARYFIPKEDLLRLIDCISLLKINTLHLHLTDDNGWRIEIKKHPLLTAVGSRRVEREGLLFHERHNQRQGEPTVEKGFYTQTDIREIVAYASSRCIEIIPEIDMPAHSNAALAAYPMLACPVVDKFIGVLPGLGGNHADIIYCAGNENVYHFLHQQDINQSEYRGKDV